MKMVTSLLISAMGRCWASKTGSKKAAMHCKEDSDDEEEQFQPVRAAPAPQAADVAPRFCQKHFTSAQREKIDPTMRSCRQCGINITSTYAAMKFCPPCSNTEERCMICGDFAPVAGNYIPPKTLNPQNPQSAPAGAVYAMPDPMGSYGQRGSAALPPPPPASASQSPSRRMADDWRMGFGSPGSQPPPPPPPPSKGRAGAGPSHSDRPHNTSRAPPRENLGGVNPPILLQAELSAAEVGGGAKDGGTLQAMYSSATGQIDGLFEYISNSLPLDIHAWTTCLNSGDQRSDVKEFGTSPKTRRRPVMRA
eukprot:Skav210983  [mRNA]  locus=scaffold1730:11347:12840:- [translate_table: standard]